MGYSVKGRRRLGILILIRDKVVFSKLEDYLHDITELADIDSRRLGMDLRYIRFNEIEDYFTESMLAYYYLYRYVNTKKFIHTPRGMHYLIQVYNGAIESEV